MCAIGRGIMARPKLLIIDELSLGLAPSMVEALAESLLKIREQDVSVLLVEQDVATAFEISDYGYVLNSGRVSLHGPSRKLMEMPAVRDAYMGMSGIGPRGDNMKARNFRYIKPRSLAHAYRILEAGGGEAVPIAGGQSLLATLNMRLSAPKVLVDISEPRAYSLLLQRRSIRLGALTRHCELVQSDLIRDRLPLLAQAAAHIGHVAIRNRGTLAGSLAYADPAAELPACSVALNARLVIGDSAGEREVEAQAFFKGLFETDLAPGELILAVKFPVPGANAVAGFGELARGRGDFALVGLAAVAELDCDHRFGSARIVYFGCINRATIAK